MPTFIGFNTQDQYKKFTLLDEDLVKRDLLNGLNIRQGQLPGRPQFGTTLWENLFENQSPALVTAIENEIQRVAGYDPRIQIMDTQVFPQENGILIQVQLAVVPNTTAQQLSIFFNQQQRRASYV
jgi:phage baseplate assembly protein W